MKKEVLDISLKILEVIKSSNNILLHCHPNPDPDSVGSVLAMKIALEKLGKKVTVIRGDTEIPIAFRHFPKANEIIEKNFFEINKDDFDLFIILDSGSKEMISRKGEVVFGDKMRTINIDHHASNPGYAEINLVDSSYSSNAQLVFDLITSWGIEINHKMAINLFMGMYTDTGGFKYETVTAETYQIASELVKIAPDFHKYIFEMENSNTSDDLKFEGLALSSIKNFLNDNIAISAISQKDLESVGLNTRSNISLHIISNLLRSVIGWNIGVCLVEMEPNVFKVSFRTRDSTKFDVSKLAIALGGGGHKPAAGASIKLPKEQAIKAIVEKAKIIYNL
jgi:phosphoesterase RecJ-like protein